jgi:hypothetical protein
MRGRDDRRVLHRAGILERTLDGGDRRALLADRDDAAHLLVDVARLPVAFWLMIVSIAIAVLPVWRSPMISWRWPRPTGIIASMALMPVCMGSCTLCAA